MAQTTTCPPQDADMCTKVQQVHGRGGQDGPTAVLLQRPPLVEISVLGTFEHRYHQREDPVGLVQSATTSEPTHLLAEDLQDEANSQLGR